MMEAHQIAELFDRHGRGLALYAAQWTDLADDCVQEAFCELARQTQPPENPAAWLFRVVRNRALNMVRAETRRRRRERLAAKLEYGASVDKTTLDRIVVAEAIETLPHDLREIVLLRIWSNLTLNEIATVLNSSVATMHRRYQTALSQMKKHFEVPCAIKNDFPTNL